MTADHSLRPLRLLLLRDWRPGHYHQVEAIAVAVAGMAPTKVSRIEIRPTIVGHGEVRDFLRWLLPPKPALLLRLLFGIRRSGIPKVDLIVASGGRGPAIAASFIRRLTGARFLQSGYVEILRAEDFDLMLVQSPGVADTPKKVVSPIPTLIDPDLLRQPRALRHPADLREAEISLLLGGETKGYSYAATDWQAIAKLVAASARANGVRWNVTTSRRTPSAALDLFVGLANDGTIARFIDFRKAGPGSAGDLYAADAIVVTQDSRSMLAEALSARRPVIVLKPASVKPTLATDEIAAMAEGGGLAVLPIDAATPERFAETLLAIEPAAQDPREALRAVLGPLVREIQARQESAPS